MAASAKRIGTPVDLIILGTQHNDKVLYETVLKKIELLQNAGIPVYVAWEDDPNRCHNIDEWIEYYEQQCAAYKKEFLEKLNLVKPDITNESMENVLFSTEDFYEFKKNLSFKGTKDFIKGLFPIYNRIFIFFYYVDFFTKLKKRSIPIDFIDKASEGEEGERVTTPEEIIADFEKRNEAMRRAIIQRIMNLSRNQSDSVLIVIVGAGHLLALTSFAQPSPNSPYKTSIAVLISKDARQPKKGGCTLEWKELMEVYKITPEDEKRWKERQDLIKHWTLENSGSLEFDKTVHEIIERRRAITGAESKARAEESQETPVLSATIPVSMSRVSAKKGPRPR